MKVSRPRFIPCLAFLITAFSMFCLTFSGCGFLSSDGDGDGSITSTASTASIKGPIIAIECEIEIPLPEQSPSAAPGLAPTRSISATMRSNLLSLQATAASVSRIQSALSSGNRINSALDGPCAFFQA